MFWYGWINQEVRWLSRRAKVPGNECHNRLAETPIADITLNNERGTDFALRTAREREVHQNDVASANHARYF